MNYEPDDLIREYFKKVGDQYPNLDLRHFNQIVRAPFRFIARCMEMDELPTILVKGLGKFKVVRATMTKLLRYNDADLKNNRIDKETHTKIKIRYREIIDGIDALKESKTTEVELIDDTELNGYKQHILDSNGMCINDIISPLNHHNGKV